MMPTKTSAGSDTLVADEPIPEVEAELDGHEAFLRAVRTLVHGEPVVSADEADASEPEPAEPVEADLGDWLPGIVVPTEQQRVPAQSTGAVTDPTESVGSRRARRRERRRAAASAVAVARSGDVLAAEPVPVGAVTAEPGSGRQARAARRRERRRAAALAVAESVPAVETEHVAEIPMTETVVPRGRAARRERRAMTDALAKGESGDRTPEPETLEQYLARVEAPLLPRRTRRSRPRTPRWLRRSAKVTFVAAIIAACVALPWAAPAVPDLLAGLVPDDQAPPARVVDPPVAPSTEVFVGPVGIAEQAGPYAGVRLEAAGEPREVRVPRLQVDSEVIPISGQSGSLLPPSDPQLLGWWREGRQAGAAEGTAVVTGHTVHTGGGAFDHLDELVVGDSLRVRTDAGWIRYVVQRTRIYGTAELARDAEKIFRLSGPGRLVMITCDDWNGESYESNAVVFATPALDQPDVS